MFHRLFAVSLASVVCVTGALGQDTKDAAEELKKVLMQLEGAWTSVSVERDGQALGEDFVKDFKLVFKDDKVTARHPAKFKLDLSKTPKRIDVTPEEGPDKDRTIEGIYELKGEDLKVCIALPGKERPKEFVSKPDSGTVLFVLKKAKADK